MRQFLKVTMICFVVIFFLHIINIFIYSFPFEITNEYLYYLISYSFVFSVFGVGLILFLLNVTRRESKNYLLMILAGICIIISIPCGIISPYIFNYPVEEKIIFQSLDDKNDAIYSQHFDYGVIGDSHFEVRTYKICFGIRYSNRFKNTILNGQWIKFENNQKKDTLNFTNYIYYSENNHF